MRELPIFIIDYLYKRDRVGCTAGLGVGHISLSLPTAHHNGQTLLKAPETVIDCSGILDVQFPPQPSSTKRGRGFQFASPPPDA